MKLKNKQTGEIINNNGISFKEGNYKTYNSLGELNAGWEDYEEPFSKDFYTIFDGEVKHCIWYRERVAACPDDAHAYLGEYGKKQIDNLKSVGIYFETEEEAEQAVERLRTWKRLKDKGFKFTGFTHKDRGRLDELEIYCQLGERPEDIEDMEDVRLLFGGEI